MTDEDRVLAGILAYGDAIWAPPRRIDWDSPHASANASIAQRGWDKGLAWHPGGPDGTARKRQQRAFDGLATAGFIRRFPSGVRLSDAGETRARCVTGLPGLNKSRIAVDALLIYGRNVWVSETILIVGRRNASYDALGADAGRLLAAHDAVFLPALSRGFVLANSDADGRVFFRATPAGIAWLDHPVPDAPNGDVDPDATDLYLATRDERREHLRSTPPADHGEIGISPLPTGGPLIRRPDGIDAPFDPGGRR